MEIIYNALCMGVGAIIITISLSVCVVILNQLRKINKK